MRITTFFATLGLALVMTMALPAQTVRVIFVSGEASLQRPDEAALRPVVKGETVIIGTRIVTGTDGRVVLTPMPGVKSIITPNTTLLLESSSETRTSATETTHQAVLDLKQGAVVTDLQKPEGVAYDYSIRTARGVAGARGTTFTVGINAAGIQTIVVTHGTIALTFTDGRQASLSLGQLSITQPGGATQSVSKISDLPEADQQFAQNWTETTINAIAAAIEEGIELDPTALNNALDAAESLGITLSPETTAAVERALATNQELADTLALLDPLKKFKDENTQDDFQNIVTDSVAQSARDLFLSHLTAEQRAAFDALPTDIQDQLVALNDPAITSLSLAPDPKTNVPHTHQDLRTHLTAFDNLSPEALAFIKTLAGSDFANYDAAPDAASWSSDAFQRTLTSWNALTSTEQQRITSLGAGEAIMDTSAGYISALLNGLTSEQASIIQQTGWGAYLDELSGKPTGDNTLYNAAHYLDDAGRAAVKFFGISPHHFHHYAVVDLVNDLAGMSDANQRLLRQLGISDAALESLSYYMPAVSVIESPSTDYTSRFQNALAFYNQLSADEKSAARSLNLGYLFYYYAPDESVGYGTDSALQRVRALTRYYNNHPELQQALRDSRLFSSHALATADSLNLNTIAHALTTYLELPARTRYYLSNHHYSFFDLANPSLSYQNNLRSLSAINSILGNLSAAEFASLIDLDLGRVVFESGDQSEGVIPFPFIDGSPVDEIQETIGYYNQLGNARKFLLRELGIIGNGNVAVIGADVDGLNRLLTAYGALPNTLRATTEKLDEYNAYYTSFGSNEGPVKDRSFFFPANYDKDIAIYAVSFRSTGNLHVGATRYLRIDGTYSPDGPTFVTGDNKNLYLHAADLIDLTSTGFSANIRGITMAAATINLTNIVFPEGSVASLNSKLGQVNFVNPNDPVFARGKVNLYNVSYGFHSLNSTSDLTSSAGANGNIAIGSLKNPAKLPTYTPTANPQ